MVFGYVGKRFARVQLLIIRDRLVQGDTRATVAVSSGPVETSVNATAQHATPAAKAAASPGHDELRRCPRSSTHAWPPCVPRLLPYGAAYAAQPLTPLPPRLSGRIAELVDAHSHRR